MKSRNKNGPNPDPWGTPLVMPTKLESLLWHNTLFVNTGSGGIHIFEVKLTFEMLTVRAKQHSFSTHERMFLWKC